VVAAFTEARNGYLETKIEFGPREQENTCRNEAESGKYLQK
jgi:hypothetical protein